MSGYQPGDTIIAPATPAAASAIALLRLSGPQAWPLAFRLLTRPPREPAAGRAFVVSLDLTALLDSESRAGSLHTRGDAAPPTAQLLDTAVLTLWAAPYSYSGEDMAELSLHGNPLLLRSAIAACCRGGARLAEAGEFTYRAYLNNKLDLAQAEAVNELISAGSHSALRLAAAALAGLPSAKLRGWVERLTLLLARIEVIHDYAADDLDASLDQSTLLTTAKLEAAIRGLLEEHSAALDASRRTAPLRSGVTVAICGPPNVGKSTLFNALLGHERSITAPESGTTRDYVSEALEASGLRLTLIDTAGYHDAADAVEAAGVRRAGEWARAADLVLWVNAADVAHQPLPPELRQAGAIEVLTRCDLLPDWPADSERLLHASGLHGRGVRELLRLLEQRVGGLGEAALDSFSQRQAGQIESSQQALQTALDSLREGMPMDAISLDLYRSCELLHGIYEQPDREAVVNTVFSAFCVGK